MVYRHFDMITDKLKKTKQADAPAFIVTDLFHESYVDFGVIDKNGRVRRLTSYPLAMGGAFILATIGEGDHAKELRLLPIDDISAGQGKVHVNHSVFHFDIQHHQEFWISTHRQWIQKQLLPGTYVLNHTQFTPQGADCTVDKYAITHITQGEEYAFISNDRFCACCKRLVSLDWPSG